MNKIALNHIINHGISVIYQMYDENILHFLDDF